MFGDINGNGVVTNATLPGIGKVDVVNGAFRNYHTSEEYAIGFNYYFYASTALRLAYEINHELNGINLHDNMLLAQFVWAF